MAWKYKDTYDPKNPMHRANGAVSAHRAAASVMLGRPLLKAEVVHHIDADRSNNKFSNLMVFTSRADHSRFHAQHGNGVIKNHDGTFSCINVKLRNCAVIKRRKTA